MGCKVSGHQTAILKLESSRSLQVPPPRQS